MTRYSTGSTFMGMPLVVDTDLPPFSAPLIVPREDAMPHLTDEQLSELERLERAATPGPWRSVEAGGPHKGQVRVEECGQAVETVATTYCGAFEGHGAANGRLIAAARNALPEMLRELRDLRWQVANWERKEVRRASCCTDNERELLALRRVAEAAKALLAKRDQVAAQHQDTGPAPMWNTLRSALVALDAPRLESGRE